MLLIAVFQNLTMGVQAGIFRQKRRVNIQQTSGVVRDKGRAQNAHIARQHHDVRRVGINLLNQLAVKGFTPGELAGFQRVRGYVRFPRALKAERVGLVAEYCPNGAVDFLLLAGVYDGLQITSVAGNEHHDVFHSMTTRCSESEALIVPIFHAFSPFSVSSLTALSASLAGRAITMPTPQLKVRYIS